jgi:hypothetical protein
MKMVCPVCHEDGKMVPVSGAFLEDSYAIAQRFEPKIAVRVILNAMAFEEKEGKIFLVCQECGNVVEVNCQLKNYLK